MRSKFIVLLVLLAVSPMFAHAQVVAAGHGGRPQFRFAVGFAASDFNMDWGHDGYGNPRRMVGITAWINGDVPVLSRALKGLAIEVEGRDINYSLPPSVHRLRNSTILGGPTYTWRSHLPVRFYAKYMAGMGSIDFGPIGNYSHDTRAVTAPGLGVEAKLYGPLWVRGDYEYQFWRKIFGPHTLNPNGFTFGIEFDSRSLGQNR